MGGKQRRAYEEADSIVELNREACAVGAEQASSPAVVIGFCTIPGPVSGAWDRKKFGSTKQRAKTARSKKHLKKKRPADGKANSSVAIIYVACC